MCVCVCVRVCVCVCGCGCLCLCECEQCFKVSCCHTLVQVNFGCILDDTERTCSITMINTSPIDVHYSWAFLDQPPLERGEDPDEGVDLEGEGQSQCSLSSSDSEEEEVESSSGRSSEDSKDSYSRPAGDERQEEGPMSAADNAEQETTSSPKGERELSHTAVEMEEGGLSKPVSPNEETPKSPVGVSLTDLQQVPADLDIVTPKPPQLSCDENSEEKEEGQWIRVKPKPAVLKEDPFVPISIQQVRLSCLVLGMYVCVYHCWLSTCSPSTK